jgi:hypothetical protein
MKVIQSKCIGFDDYVVTIHGPNKATVEGGILPKPFTITKLLGDGDANPKTKSVAVTMVGLSLFPARGVRIPGFNICPKAVTCVASCLAHQGQGPVPTVKGSRAAKTVLFALCRDWFMARLRRELDTFVRNNPDVPLGARLNMFSDVEWETLGIIDEYPMIQFYDYTKIPTRSGWLRPNYYVCLSYDGTNRKDCVETLRNGGSVSVVFYDTDGKCGKAAVKQQLPQTWEGFKVFDGNVTDWRPDDAPGTVCGLPLRARTYASRDNAIKAGFAQLSASVQ